MGGYYGKPVTLGYHERRKGKRCAIRIFEVRHVVTLREKQAVRTCTIMRGETLCHYYTGTNAGFNVTKRGRFTGCSVMRDQRLL